MKVLNDIMDFYYPPKLNSVDYPNSLLYFYELKRSDLICIFADEDLTTAMPNPVVSNCNGVFSEIFFIPKTSFRYEFISAKGELLKKHISNSVEWNE